MAAPWQKSLEYLAYQWYLAIGGSAGTTGEATWAKSLNYWLWQIAVLYGETATHWNMPVEYWLYRIYVLNGGTATNWHKSAEYWARLIYGQLTATTPTANLSLEYWLYQIGQNATPPSVWYEAAGVTPIIAYQPKGAASLAASYINLPNPGTFDAAPGVAPTWDTLMGWSFDGLTQHLENGLTLNRPLTILLRASQPATDNGAFINTAGTSGLTGLAMGIGTTFSGSDDILTVLANLIAWRTTGTAANLAGFTFGVTFDTVGDAYALYVDGVAVASGMSNVNVTAGTMRIANTGLGGADPAFSMQALAAWDSVLTAPQLAAVATAMAAL